MSQDIEDCFEDKKKAGADLTVALAYCMASGPCLQAPSIPVR